MKSTLILTSLCTAALVAADLNLHTSDLLNSNILQIRDLTPGSSRRLVRRQPTDRRSTRPQSPSSGRASGSGAGSSGGKSRGGAGAGPSSSSPSSSGGKVKAAVTLEGPGAYSGTSRMEPSHERTPVAAGDVKRARFQSSKQLHLHAHHDPDNGEQTSRRWPLKTNASGESTIAMIKTAPGGRGHMLLTSPDEPAKQINVPGGSLRVGAIGSKTPGGARVRTAVSKGGIVDITTTKGGDTGRTAALAAVAEQLGGPGEGVQSDLPTQFGKMSMNE